MKIAVCSDEPYSVNQFIVEELKKGGHTPCCFGSLLSGKTEPWAKVTYEAAQVVATGKCDEGIFFCWTGTGVSMVANKIPGIRAALCIDAEMAKGARIWNHANVLVLSNRLLTIDLAKEILSAWFDTSPDQRGEDQVNILNKIDSACREK